MSPHDAPPKPILTLRVAVTGHRANKLGTDATASVQAQIEALLQDLHQQLARLRLEHANLYAEATPSLRVICSLAEGADRVVATAALRQHCELMAVLPFAHDLYVNDFVEQGSRDEFAALIGKASTIIELDGRYAPPEARNEGYASAGENVVRQSDLLVAVWDGRPAGGRGGTAEIIDYAREIECPVLWFPSEGKSSHYYGDPMRLLLPDRSILVGAEKELLPCLGRMFLPSPDQVVRKWAFVTGNGDADATNSITQYFSERAPRWPMYRFFDRFFDWFQKLVNVASHASATASTQAPAIGHGAASLTPNLSAADAAAADDFVAEVGREWNEQMAGVTNSRGFHDSKLERLAAHYGWLDRLSAYYGGLYRSAYLINYLLAAGAVLVAATSTHVGSILEIIFLVAILGLSFWGMGRGWHRRWIEYRELAERLRTTRYLRVVASPPVTAELPLHLHRPDDAIAQTDWLHGAIVRECGLPSIAFAREYCERVRKYLVKNEVSDQIRYHHRNRARMHVFDHRLHLLSVSSFVVAFVIALLHLLRGLELNYLAVLLPALGSALYGIRNQGEFVRVSERSERMEAALTSIQVDLEESAGTIADREMLEAKAQVIAKTMLSETTDWLKLFRARPLELPT